MSSTDSDNKETDTNYWHIKHANLDSEVERLDSLHRGLKTYMDGKLCLAPLGDLKPAKILELGAGTGTWAVEAAELFPEADVLATDISPLPERPLPPNVKYMYLNVLETIPLEPASFDIVHARFTFIHLPKPLAALARITALLKPGGWLLLEDVSVNADVKGDVPGIRAAYTALVHTWEQAGQEPRYAAGLEAKLRESGEFDIVDVQHIPLPIHPLSEDPKIRGLGETIRQSWNRSFSYEPSPALVAAGYTPEMYERRKIEMNATNGQEWSYGTDIYIVGARKRADV